MPRNEQNRTIGLQQIREALIKSGYSKLDQQAKALGVRRSTAWIIVKAKHKLGRLNAKTARCILSNPDTPPSVRSVIEKYVGEEVRQFARYRIESDPASPPVPRAEAERQSLF